MSINRYWQNHEGNDIEESQVTFHPNPVRDELYIAIEKTNAQEAILEIYDLFCRKIDRQVIMKSRSTTVNVSDYLPGIYIGIVQLENKKVLVRFVKE